MPASGRKHGGVLLGTLAVAIAVAAAVAAVRASDEPDTTSASSGDPMAGMDHGRKHPPSVVDGAPGPGVPAPDFDVARLRGPGRVRLADYAGRPLLLTFWASWCVSCRKEFPNLRELRAAHRDDDLAIVGITYRDLPDDSRSFAKKFRADFTLGKGGEGDPVAHAYGIRAIPQLYFIDRNGVIRERLFGAPSVAAMEAAVAEISAG